MAAICRLSWANQLGIVCLMMLSTHAPALYEKEGRLHSTHKCMPSDASLSSVTSATIFSCVYASYLKDTNRSTHRNPIPFLDSAECTLPLFIFNSDGAAMSMHRYPFSLCAHLFIIVSLEKTNKQEIQVFFSECEKNNIQTRVLVSKAL